MKPLKILFATIPFDGHFNPLTSLAVYLKGAGHDVRWYTQEAYENKLKKLGIHHYPFQKALQLNQYNLDTIFAERLKHKDQIKRLNFDLQNVFVLRTSEFFEDICEINKTFTFDVLIADVMFTALPVVRHRLHKPVIAVGVVPLIETSKDLAPAGLGMAPDYSFIGKQKQKVLRFLTDRILFGRTHKLFRKVLSGYGIKANGNTMDFLIKSSTLFLQSGTPGFEYKRSDLGKNIRYIGALLPMRKQLRVETDLNLKKRQFKKVILVTQGTIEKDPQKLIVPTLEAFKDTENLVIATTGGSGTEELRSRYPYDNIVVEDFIPFGDVLPFTDVYVTNGGYGGVMLSIEHQVPMVVAGIHEGKNEINARVGYFRLGINLHTETPSPELLRKSVNEVLMGSEYKTNTARLGNEFRKYNPERLCEKYVYEATGYRIAERHKELVLQD